MESVISDIPYKRPPLEYPPPANCIDSILRSFGFNKPQPFRRPVLTKAQEVCNYPEAMERIKYTLNQILEYESRSVNV